MEHPSTTWNTLATTWNTLATAWNTLATTIFQKYKNKEKKKHMKAQDKQEQ